MSARLNFFLSACLLLLALACWGQGLWIFAKAQLAQVLIAQSWQASLASGEAVKPWAWADTWPAAKLEFPSLEKEFYVLEGDNGAALAFGPGITPTTGHTHVIHGHRDTHFAALQDLHPGDPLTLQLRDGTLKTYKVSHTVIVNIEQGDWHIDPGKSELHLITCYPFDALRAGGPLRWVVVAKRSDVPAQKSFILEGAFQ